MASVSFENWSAWEENEAAQLMKFLGLDQTGERFDIGAQSLYKCSCCVTTIKIFLACSQTLYFLFSVRRARVIKNKKPRGIY